MAARCNAALHSTQERCQGVSLWEHRQPTSRADNTTAKGEPKLLSLHSHPRPTKAKQTADWSAWPDQQHSWPCSVYNCVPRTAGLRKQNFTLRIPPCLLCYTLPTPRNRGRIAQRLERRTRDRKASGSSPGWSGGIILFSRVNRSVLTYHSVSVPPPCYRSST